jgi:hypothetical protein
MPFSKDYQVQDVNVLDPRDVMRLVHSTVN